MKMKDISLLFLLVITLFNLTYGQNIDQKNKFDFDKDLLLVHYDFKTDVDDLHSAAAFASLIRNNTFSNLHYHAVAGTYGIQEGLYVPPNELMTKAFQSNWSDAHLDFQNAIDQVSLKVFEVLTNDGHVWIADGGQSDFSAALVRRVREEYPAINTTNLVHIIQHSTWNEEVTSKDALAYVKKYSNYQKIPDGNAEGNGTPGFRSPQILDLDKYSIDNEILEIWKTAIRIANKYNGHEGRYLNEAIKEGGLDFSDFSEVCHILSISGIQNAKDFFSKYIN